MGSSAWPQERLLPPGSLGEEGGGKGQNLARLCLLPLHVSVGPVVPGHRHILTGVTRFPTLPNPREGISADRSIAAYSNSY